MTWLCSLLLAFTGSLDASVPLHGNQDALKTSEVTYGKDTQNTTTLAQYTKLIALLCPHRSRLYWGRL